jgi:hypothetical protein
MSYYSCENYKISFTGVKNMNVPQNGAPMTILYGINDKSIRQPTFEFAPRSIHLPLVLLYTQWGPSEPELVYGSTREALYGDATFDMRSKWATHATLYANLFSNNANPMMIKRVIPHDASGPANVRMGIEVSEVTEDEYERNSDGSFKRDVNNQYITTGERIPVLKVRFVTKHIDPTEDGASNVGKGTIELGDQISGGEQSKFYPIFDYELPYIGSLGNDYGFRVWGPTTKDANPLNTVMMEKNTVYPFRFAFVKNINRTSTSNPLPTNNGEYYIDFALKPGLIDKVNDMSRYLGDIISNNYQNLNPTEGFPVNQGPVGRFHIYQENIDLILEKAFNLESSKNYTHNELSGHDVEDGKYLFNLFGGVNSNGAPYQSYRFAPATVGSVRPTDITSIYASGGSDGTMSKDFFDAAVADEISKFADENSEWQDIIGRPCTFFWDSGFSMETKYALGKFISLRKNTIVILSTHVDGENKLSVGEESARVVSLSTRVRSYAESDFFGTEACRFSICAQSGLLPNSSYMKRVSLSYELANKVSMLANSNKFKSAKLFHIPGNNTIDLLTDINNPWVPAKVRHRDWAAGMLYAERLERRKYYFPALRTGYKEDSSVLTSLTTVMAAAEIETIGDEIRRRFSGNQLPKGVLQSEVEEAFLEAVKDKFADLFVIEAQASITTADDSRGYSWTLVVRIYADTPKTVMSFIIESHRRDELNS